MPSTLDSTFKVGSADVDEMYVGSSLVYSSTPPSTNAWDSADVYWNTQDIVKGDLNWTDRNGGLVLALNGASPPTYNEFLKSLDFRGAVNYLEHADNALLDLSGDFTVAVVLESLTPGQTAKTIIGKKNSYGLVPTTAIGWALRSSGTGRVEANIAATTAVGYARNSQDMPTVSATVGMQRSGDQLITFVEGVASAPLTATAGDLSNDRTLRVGANSATTVGNIGDWRLWAIGIWHEVI